MPKAKQVLAALQRDGWRLLKEKGGSHRRLEKAGERRTWAFHEIELGKVQIAQIAKTFGYTVQELRKLI